MASTNSTVDGMGFEEMNQTGSQTANVWLSGSITTQEGIQTAGDISGAGALSIGAVTASQLKSIGSVVDANGAVLGTSIENASELYGYRVKAGSLTMGNSVSGLVNFKTPFTTATYFLVAGAREYGAPQWSRTGSQGLGYGISGTMRASGCWLVGGSATEVNWIAVGI